MLFVGLGLPVVVGWWLLSVRQADIWLSLLGLVAMPLIFWSAALYLKIGPCDVGDCMTASEHSRLVLSLPGFALLLVAFGLLAVRQSILAAASLIAGLVVCGIGVTRTDNTITIALVILAVGAAGYMYFLYADRPGRAVPDFPPAS